MAYQYVRGVLIVLAAVTVIYAGLSIYGAHAATVVPRLPLADITPAAVGLAYEDVAFLSRGENITLRGWYLPSEGRTVIPIIHGGYQNRLDDNVDTLNLAHDLVSTGYDVLLFDLRGRGESQGKGQVLRNIEADIGGAVDYLRTRGFSDDQICLLGFCAGAAASAVFASRENIGAVVLVGCFATVKNMVVRQAVKYGIPGFIVHIFAPGVMLACRTIYRFTPVDPQDVIGGIDCPVFFIHEEKDEYITQEEMRHLYRLARNPQCAFWEVEGSLHSQSYRTQPQEFIRRIDGFLRKAREGEKP
ncbi:MAG: alpha/beta hydrolase [Dehalococcoidales bacterium]|nr:alpha/beta hydrolase [Dehalococcoidales bacterium]